MQIVHKKETYPSNYSWELKIASDTREKKDMDSSTLNQKVNNYMCACQKKNQTMFLKVKLLLICPRFWI